MALVERYHTQDTRPAISPDIDEPRQSAIVNTESGRVVRQAVSLVQSEERAKHVGILALEVYFPDIYVSVPLSSMSVMCVSS